MPHFCAKMADKVASNRLAVLKARLLKNAAILRGDDSQPFTSASRSSAEPSFKLGGSATSTDAAIGSMTAAHLDHTSGAGEAAATGMAPSPADEIVLSSDSDGESKPAATQIAAVGPSKLRATRVLGSDSDSTSDGDEEDGRGKGGSGRLGAGRLKCLGAVKPTDIGGTSSANAFGPKARPNSASAKAITIDSSSDDSDSDSGNGSEGSEDGSDDELNISLSKLRLNVAKKAVAASKGRKELSDDEEGQDDKDSFIASEDDEDDASEDGASSGGSSDSGYSSGDIASPQRGVSGRPSWASQYYDLTADSDDDNDAADEEEADENDDSAYVRKPSLSAPSTPSRRQLNASSSSSSSSRPTFRPASLKDGQPHPVTGRVVIVEEEEVAAYGRARSAPMKLTPSKRLALTSALFVEYNRTVFRGSLPADVAITWNARLTKTAGLTFTSKKAVATTAASSGCGSGDGSLSVAYLARIELSVKVLDTPAKLASTLLHEMCHAAAWAVDHVSKPPHGAVFRRWADRASRAYPNRAVTTCHSYEISYKHVYACVGEGEGPVSGCGAQWGRHSKSIDVATARCGKCRGRIAHVGAGTLSETAAPERGGSGSSAESDGDYTASAAPATPQRAAKTAAGAAPPSSARRTPSAAQSAYQAFLKANRPAVAAANPGYTPAQVLAEVGRQWTAAKVAAGASCSATRACSSGVSVGDGGEIDLSAY